MHKKFYPVFLLSCLLINSCKTDFNIVAPYKPISVVYGLLDPAASVQYIKINKAFEGEGNALVMAQQQDSLNYAPGVLTVQLQSNYYGQLGTIYTLDTTTTIPKDPGLFSNPYQLLYKTNANFPRLIQDGVTTYNLIITNNSNHQVITSSTAIVDSINTNTITPAEGDLINFSGLGGATYTVQFQASVNARVYNLVIRFSYTEINTSTNDTASKYIDWNQGNQVSQFLNGSEQIVFVYNKADFYTFLASQLVASPNIKRVIGYNPLDFMIYFAGDELNTYIEVNQPSLGIVQDVPEYTNIIGGVGIFSSRSSVNLYHAIDPISIHSLQYGQYTSGLNFQ